MPPRPPNFQAIALLVSGTFNTLGALWIYADARARRADKPLFAALAMLLLGPLWLAFYMTDRPLRADERRHGGFGWNWIRNFAIAWTAGMAPWFSPAILIVLARDPTTSATPAFMSPLIVWLVPIAATTAIGYAIRRPDQTEPGGPAPARTRVPLLAVPIAATLLTLLLLNVLYGAGGGGRTRTALRPSDLKSSTCTRNC
jgi:hypothetical protein